MRFSIEEYSQRFKMSKEMIHSRMRNKRLNYIIEDGITYIIVPRSSLDMESRREIHEEKKEQEKLIKEEVSPSVSQPTAAPKKTTVGTIIALYQKENHQLKARIKELEAKIDKLIDDKERMLIDERNRIEQVYSTKDEQLKSILELINTKMLTSVPQTVHDVHIDNKEEVVETYDASWHSTHLVELKKYMKTLDIAAPERKIIKRRFTSGYGHDIRIIQQNGEFYLDFSKYDYSDLLNH
jgi:small-conductance mechanosensitive channel